MEVEDDRDVRDRLIRIETKLDNLGKIETQSTDAYNLSKANEQDIKELKERQDKIENKLENQEQKKGMKWDKLIDYLFYVILAYCLWKIGLKP